MKIINVETIGQLKELYDSSAMTWEGLDSNDFGKALEAVSQQGVDGTGYATTGKVMNELTKLTGSNRYPDDLTIFSIKDFNGLAISWGARWMDDIIDNNLNREKTTADKIFKK